MTNFKADGASLVANGYSVVAIKPRIKYPDYPSWQKNAATTPQAVAELAAQLEEVANRNHGVESRFSRIC